MKQAIILLHGALGTKEQFSQLAPLLHANFEVHSFNFEGHGDLPSDNDFSIDLFTQNLSRYISEKKLSNLVLFGYSMGGYVALNYARQSPEAVSKIITYATKFDWTPESALTETRKLNPDILEEKVPKFAHFLAKIHTYNEWKNMMRKTAKMMLDIGNKDAFTANQLHEISTPVILTVGSEDTMVSIRESELASSLLKNAELKVLNGFVHPLEQNDLQVFADLLMN